MSDDEFREAMYGLAAFMACEACARGDDELRLEHIRNGHFGDFAVEASPEQDE